MLDILKNFLSLCWFCCFGQSAESEGASDAFATSVRPPPPARERAAADGDGSSTSSRMAWKLVEPAPTYKRKSCVRPSVPPRIRSPPPPPPPSPPPLSSLPRPSPPPPTSLSDTCCGSSKHFQFMSDRGEERRDRGRAQEEEDESIGAPCVVILE